LHLLSSRAASNRIIAFFAFAFPEKQHITIRICSFSSAAFDRIIAFIAFAFPETQNIIMHASNAQIPHFASLLFRFPRAAFCCVGIISVFYLYR